MIDTSAALSLALDEFGIDVVIDGVPARGLLDYAADEAQARGPRRSAEQLQLVGFFPHATVGATLVHGGVYYRVAHVATSPFGDTTLTLRPEE